MRSSINFKNIVSFTTLTFFMIISIQSLQKVFAVENPYDSSDSIDIPDFNFASAGDWSCSPDARSTLQNMIRGEPELVLGLGDYSYQTTAKCWLELVDPIDHKMKIAIGNHEDAYSNGTGILYSLPSLLQEYMNHFNLSKQFYSFSYQNIFFVTISTEVPLDSNSEQYKFVAAALDKAEKDPKFDWTVFFFHRPAYASGNKSVSELRDTYHRLFEKYDVDVVIQAHSHNYQRTFPITYNDRIPIEPHITDHSISSYHDPKGQIFIVVGTGGDKRIDKLIEPAPDFIATQFNAYGYLNIDLIDNGTRLIGTFYNNNGSIGDKFTIAKSEFGKIKTLNLSK